VNVLGHDSISYLVLIKFFACRVCDSLCLMVNGHVCLFAEKPIRVYTKGK